MSKEDKDNAVGELKDVPEVEDFFERILNEDIEMPETEDDDPKFKSPSPDTSEEKVEKEPKDSSDESVESLKAKIAQLEKEAKGRLNDAIKSRQEKSLFKSELSELKSAVAQLLEKRNAPAEDPVENKLPPLSSTRKAIEFGDDDKAFVDLTEVKEAITAETAATKAELAALKEERAMEELKKSYEKNVANILSEDEERFKPAFESLKQIFKDFNDKVIELQERTGEMGNGGVLEQDAALDLFSGSPEEEAFLKDHPGLDPTRIARAFNTKADLRVGLRHIADVNKIGVKAEKETTKGVLDEKIKAAKLKPGSLAGQGNQTRDTDDLIARIATLSWRDLEGLSDAEAAKIEAMLLNEELKS